MNTSLSAKRSPGARGRGLCLIAAILILVGGLFTAEEAGAYYFGKNKVHYDSFDWQVYHSPHFELYYYPEEEILASQAILLAEQAYERLAQRLDHRPKGRIPLVLYSSHPSFQQTNVTSELISEGTGGFTEIYRSRVVLPYTGSVPQFRHVVTHELVHVFALDMLFGGAGPEHVAVSLANQFAMPPLWFIEGMAEYLSTGWDAEAELYLEDAVASEYLAPLTGYVYGFLNYKEGQAAMAFLAENYGEGILPELLREMRGRGGLERVLKRRTGLSYKELSEKFLRETKKQTWSRIAEREAPSDQSFLLLDHEKEGRGFHLSPSFSPRGDRVAYFADNNGEVNVYLASSIDGKVLRKLITGHRSSDLESLHPFTSRVAFDPEGNRLAFMTLAGGQDELVIISADNGDELKRFRPDLDTMRSPAWSPDGRLIAFSGVAGGVTDLYALAAEDGHLERLTEDLADEQDPAWVDSQTLLYARHEELVPGRFDYPSSFAPAFLDIAEFGNHPGILDAGRGYEIWELNLGGIAIPRTSTAGDDRNPMSMADGRVLFTSTVAGLQELWLAPSNATAAPRRVYAPSGGIGSPSLANDKSRLAFSSLHRGGYDIYVLEDLPFHLEDDDAVGELAAADPEQLVFVPFGAEPDASDLAPPRAVRLEPDSLTGSAGPYSTRFLVEATGRNLVYDTLYGFYGNTYISFKDVLGDQEIIVYADLVGSFSNANMLASYIRRKSRFSWSVGGFSFLSYYRTGVGIDTPFFPPNRYYMERRSGGYLAGSYPFSLFTRFEAEIMANHSLREYYDNRGSLGEPLPPPSSNNPDFRYIENRYIVQTAFSLVHDDALFDYLGPVKGSRWVMSMGYSQNVGGDVPISRWMAYTDWRRYFLGPGGHSLAFRFSGNFSGGLDPNIYYLGGPYDLRGYEYLEFAGNRTMVSSVEWRFPFINYVWFGGPLPFQWGGIGGALFADVGAAWFGNDFVPLDRAYKTPRLGDLKGDFGYGFRMRLGSFLLLWDFAWPTDLKTRGPRKVHFSFGTQF